MCFLFLVPDSSCSFWFVPFFASVLGFLDFCYQSFVASIIRILDCLTFCLSYLPVWLTANNPPTTVMYQLFNGWLLLRWQNQCLVVRRSLVWFPWSACPSVLGQDTEPETAPDVLVGSSHGSHRHQCMNIWFTVVFIAQFTNVGGAYLLYWFLCKMYLIFFFFRWAAVISCTTSANLIIRDNKALHKPASVSM